MSALVLFDVDGTLLLSGGAGARAMAIAFERVFGVADAGGSAALEAFAATMTSSTAALNSFKPVLGTITVFRRP